MANVTLRALEVARTVSGNSPQTMSFPEAASQTFKRGALVYLDSSGRVAVATASQAAFLGVASHDASGTAGTDVIVWIANDDTLFVGNLTSAGAITASSWSDITRNYGVIVVGNNWHVDKAGANRRVIVLDLDRRDGLPATTGAPATGDVGARVHFMILGNFTQLYATS